MKSITINGDLRAAQSKQELKTLRAEGKVPCVLYGGNEQVHFSAPVLDFRHLVYTPDVNTVNLNVGGKTYSAIMKDIQFHPVTDKIMHIELPILGGHVIMATDMLESMGHKLVEGNNVTISLNPDTREEADRLFKELNNGDKECVAPRDEFWGYWGTCKDRFGIRWMFNVMNPPQGK